jgi:hypothetical protein
VNFAAGDEYRYLTHDSPPATTGRSIPATPVRLRCLAGLVLASPIIAWALSRTLDAVFDGNPAAHVDLDGPGWWFALVVGLGLLALDQVFAEGARLRELEETTV